MNEFDLLGAAINAAIKHAKHNQKLHGRRGNSAGGAQYEQTAMDFDAPPPRPRSPDEELVASDVSVIPFVPVPGTDRVTLPNYLDDVDAERKYRILGDMLPVQPTKEERLAVALYQDTGHIGINGTLNGRPDDGRYRSEEKISEAIGHIDNLMQRSRTPTDFTVYRGITVDDAKFQEMTSIGAVLNRRGYLSTTTSMITSAVFAKAYGGSAKPNGRRVIMHVRVPAGNRALHAASASNTLMSEREILLPRNSNMVVRDVKKQEYPGYGTTEEVYHVYLDVMPD